MILFSPSMKKQLRTGQKPMEGLVGASWLNKLISFVFEYAHISEYRGPTRKSAAT